MQDNYARSLTLHKSFFPSAAWGRVWKDSKINALHGCFGPKKPEVKVHGRNVPFAGAAYCAAPAEKEGAFVPVRVPTACSL